MFTTNLAATLVAPLALSSTSLPQSGDTQVGTATYYSGGGCTGTADSEAIFNANVCEPIATVPDTVTSADVISANSGCTATFYTNNDCTQGLTVGVVGHCEQANAPFTACEGDVLGVKRWVLTKVAHS